MLVRHNSVGLAVTENICRVSTHDRRIESVLTGRIAAALHVAKNRCSCLDSCRRLDSLCHGGRVSDSLSIDNDMMCLSFLPASDNVVDQLLLIVIIFLGKKDILRAVCNACPECNVPRMSAHYLDDGAALMGRGGISYLVNRLHRGVDRRVKTNRILCTCNVKINRSRHTDRIDAMSGKSLRTSV